MAIADTINSIRTHLQADYESLENIGAELENVDKNIENIASVVNGIYDNLPKTTGEGTNLSLTTIKGKMGIIPKGDTSQNGTPTPSTPIDIEAVTGIQEVKVENVNLIPLEQADFTTTFSGQNVEIKNQTIKISGSATGNYSIIVGKNGLVNTTSTDRITFEIPSGSYIYTQFASGTATNINVRLKDENTNTMYRTGQTITLTETHTFSINILVEGNDSKNATINIQLEKGSTSTPYTPHQEQTQTLSLGDIELCKIGNYQDYLYKSNDNWYKKEYIGKHILSTSDTWALNRSSNNLYQYRTKNGILEDVITSPDPYSRPVALCNYYTKGDINGMTTQCFNIGGLKYIGITSDISTLANFNTFITNNSIYVYYVCQTPSEIEITDTTLIDQLNNLEKAQSYNGTTNISSSGNLPMILNVSALKGE